MMERILMYDLEQVMRDRVEALTYAAYSRV